MQFSHLIAQSQPNLLPAAFLGDSSESTPNQLAEGSPCHHQLATNDVFSKQYLWNTSMHVGAYIRTNLQHIRYPSA